MLKLFLVVATFLMILSSCAPLPSTNVAELESTKPLLYAVNKPTEALPRSTHRTTRIPITKTPIITTQALTTPTTEAILQPVTIPNLPIEKRCLGGAELPLAELGPGESSNLVVTPDEIYENIGSWMLIDRNLKALPIFEDISNRQFNYWISPNKQWIAFRLRNGGNSTYSLWINSIDGKKQVQILKDVGDTTLFRWTCDQTLVAIDREVSAPTLRVHPFILPTEAELKPVILDYDFGAYAFNSDATNLIYLTPVYDKSRHWVLYDYQTGESRTALPTMDVSRIEIPTDVWLNWKAENLSLALVGENSLELALNIPADALPQQEFPEYRIIFPEKSVWLYVDWWSTDSRFIAFTRIFSLDRTGPSQSHILDTKRWVLYDYCLDTSGLRVSADEQFFATTEYEANSLKGTWIVEISTGRRSFLEGVRVVDWAEVAENNSP